jgi:hypothetical protein
MQRRKTAKIHKGRKIKDTETHSTTLWGAPIFSEMLKKKTKRRHPRTITEALLLSKCANELLPPLNEVDFNL